MNQSRRPALLRQLGWAGAAASSICPGCDFIGTQIMIGEAAFVDRGVLIDAANARVTIGERVHIGHRTMLITTSHELADAACRAGHAQ